MARKLKSWSLVYVIPAALLPVEFLIYRTCRLYSHRQLCGLREGVADGQLGGAVVGVAGVQREGVVGDLRLGQRSTVIG